MKFLYLFVFWFPFSFLGGDGEKVSSVSQDPTFTLTCTARQCFDDEKISIRADLDDGNNGNGGDFTFVWYENSTVVRTEPTTNKFDELENINFSALSNYSVHVTDNVNNMTTSCSSTVITLSTTDFQITGNIEHPCFNEGDGEIKIIPSSPPASLYQYEYTWNDNTNTTNEITGLYEGIYNVTVTEATSSCAISSSFYLNDYDPILVTTSNIIPVSYSTASDGSFSINVEGGSGLYDIEVTDENGNEDSTEENDGSTFNNLDLGKGIHYVYVTDSQGCTGSAEVEVPEPRIFEFSSNPICAEATYIEFYGEHFKPNAQLKIRYVKEDGSTGTNASAKISVVSENTIRWNISSTPIASGVLSFHYVDIGNIIQSPSSELVVITSPDPSVNGFDQNNPNVFCSDEQSIQLQGIPGGGTFTSDINGLVTQGENFQPNSVPEPDTSISGILTYEYISMVGNTGCTTKTIDYDITIHKAPDLSAISNISNTNVSQNAGIQSLFTVLGLDPSDIASGYFSGQAVANNEFHPDLLNDGDEVIITYTANNNNCPTSATTKITITEPSAIIGLESKYCSGGMRDPICGQISGRFELIVTPASSAASTATATVSGSGNEPCISFVPGSVLSPTSVTVEARYYDTDNGTLIASYQQEVIINPLPSNLAITNQPEYCQTPDSSVMLTGSHDNLEHFFKVNGDQQPLLQLSDDGDQNILYSVTDGNSCTNTTSTTIQIKSQPSVVIDDNLLIKYCEDPSYSEPLTGMTSATNGAEVFSIVEPDGQTISPISNFVPDRADQQPYIVTYTVTDNGCSNSISQQVLVTSPPTISITNLKNQYCQTPNGVIDLTGTASGANPFIKEFYIDGVFTSDNTLPLIDDGTYLIAFVVTDDNNCSSTATHNVSIIPTPEPMGIDIETNICFSETNSILLEGTNPNVDYTFDIIKINGPTYTDAEEFVLNDAGNYTINYTVTDYSGLSCTNTASHSLTVRRLPDPGTLIIGGEYCQNEDQKIPLKGSNNSQGISYQFEIQDPDLNIVQIDTFIPQLAGTYNITYTVTDNAYNCQSSKVQSIVVNPLPTPQAINLNNEYCQDLTNEISLEEMIPDQNIKYVFDIIEPGATTANIDVESFTPSIIGTYQIQYTVTDGNDCVSTAQQEVIVNPLPDPETINLNAEYCIDPTLIISLTGTNASVTYDFTIEKPDNGGTLNNAMEFSPAIEGTYEITYLVTDTNTMCTSTATQTVLVNPLPVPEDLTLLPEYCQSNSLEVTLEENNAVSGVSYVFDIQQPDSTVLTDQTVFKPEFAGTYVVQYTVTDGNNCVNTDQQEVIVNPLPDPQTTNLNSPYCHNPQDTISLTGTNQNVNYVFDIVDPNGIITDDAVEFIPEIVGPYQIQYTVTDDKGCVNSAQQEIIVNPLPAPLDINLNSEYCINPNQVILLEGTNPNVDYAFNILEPDSTEITNANNFTPEAVGIYEIRYTVTDANGCTNTALRNITVHPLPTPEIISLGDEYCVDPTINITLTGNYPNNTHPNSSITFDIKKPNNQGILFGATTFSPEIVGNYEITYTVTDDNSCTNSTMFPVTVHPLPQPQILGVEDDYCISPDSIVYLYGTEAVDSSFTVIDPNGNIHQDTISFYPAIVGSYQIQYTVTDENGCVNTTTKDFIVNPLPQPFIFGLDSTYCTNEGTNTWTSNPQPGIYLLKSLSAGHDSLDGAAFNEGAYPDPGFYNLEYIYTDGNGCTDSTFLPVSIYAPPVVDFEIDGACEEYPITFTSASNSGNASTTVSSYNWTHPQGSGTGATYTYTFPSSDSINITHVVTNNKGCSADSTKGFPVGGNPDFYYELPVACEGDVITFTLLSDDSNYGLNPDLDTIENIIYDYGDGIIVNSTDTSTTHSYTSPGVYLSSIEIQTNNACTFKVERLVFIVPQVADYPYCEDFESNNTNWFTSSKEPRTDTLWRQKVTNNPSISDTDHNKVWATYNSGTEPDFIPELGFDSEQDGWVYGPCFDLSSLERPFLSIDVYYDTQEQYDGIVVETSNDGIVWTPLGKPNKGLEWYTNVELFAAPGDQDYDPPAGKNPVGWTGNSGGWKTARFKLDHLKETTDLRVRVAFNSLDHPTTGLVAAFDNFCIKSRQQNILMEHFTNLFPPNAEAVDEALYDRCFGTYAEYNDNPYDLILLQYHIGEPSPDPINLTNDDELNGRGQRYSISQPLNIAINGEEYNGGGSLDWSQNDLEKIMLRDAIFEIELDDPSFNGTDLELTATVRALEDLSFTDEIDLYFAVAEDNISEANRDLRNVVRKMVPNNVGISIDQNWAAGQTRSYTRAWNPTNISNNSEIFAACFIQDRENDVIYQSASSQEVIIIEDPIGSNVNHNNEQSLTLHPNPTSQQVQVTLALPHNHPVKWELFDVAGRQVAQGKQERGVQQFNIPTRQFPNGTYFLVVYDDNGPMAIQEKLIIIH